MPCNFGSPAAAAAAAATCANNSFGSNFGPGKHRNSLSRFNSAFSCFNSRTWRSVSSCCTCRTCCHISDSIVKSSIGTSAVASDASVRRVRQAALAEDGVKLSVVLWDP